MTTRSENYEHPFPRVFEILESVRHYGGLILREFRVYDTYPVNNTSNSQVSWSLEE